uniref:autotransporter domain-containing protein n=1 Tax=Conchiformibius steedae TaxID=153493 RepID=UPI0026EEE65F
ANWADKTDLGTLKSDHSGASEVYALSADGKIAAGGAHNDAGEERAVVWSGANWADKTDLGTLKSDHSGESRAYALNADGTVALGVAETDTDGTLATALWRIRYGGAAPTPPSTTAIHADNTRQTLVEMGKDTLAAVNMQQHALQRLHDTACTPTNGSKMCVRLQSDVSAHENKRDTAAGAALAYRFNDNWLAGVAFDRSLKRRLPDSYRSSGKGNHGVAVYGQWENNGWFIRPSAAWNDYRVRAVRPVLSGTEAGTGKSRMKGQSYRLTFGQQSTQDKNRLTWYAGAEHSRVSRAAYTESNAEFPVRYADLRVSDTAVLMGAYSDVELSPSWSLLAGTEMARTVKAKAPEYDARAEYVGAFRYTGNKPKTRMLASAGVRYRLSPALSLSLLPYWERSAAGENRRGVRAGLVGEF